MEYEDVIKQHLKELLNDLCMYKYDNMYSTRDYSNVINQYQDACNTMFDVCSKLGIDITDVKGDYCRYELDYSDLYSFQDNIDR